MKIVNTATNEVIAEIITNHSMTLDEAIQLVGEIDQEADNENVRIAGKLYYYDDLKMVY